MGKKKVENLVSKAVSEAIMESSEITKKQTYRIEILQTKYEWSEKKRNNEV